jgi:hypothetical protein
MKAVQFFTEGREGATLPPGAPTPGPSLPERSSTAFGGLRGPSPVSRSPLGETRLGDLLEGAWRDHSPHGPVSRNLRWFLPRQRVGQQEVPVRLLCEERVSSLPPAPRRQPNETIEI